MRFRSAVVVFAVLSINAIVFAGKPDYLSYISTGGSIPVSPSAFMNDWNINPNVGVGIGQFISERLTLSTYFELNRFGRGSRNIPGGVEEIVILTFSAEMKKYLTLSDRKKNYYFEGGIGYFSLIGGDAFDIHILHTRTSFQHEESNFALFLGPGTEFAFSSNHNWYAAIRHTICFTPGARAQYAQIKIGMRFGGR